MSSADTIGLSSQGTFNGVFNNLTVNGEFNLDGGDGELKVNSIVTANFQLTTAPVAGDVLTATSTGVGVWTPPGLATNIAAGTNVHIASVPGTDTIYAVNASQWMVDANGLLGNYTTIQSAMNAANAYQLAHPSLNGQTVMIHDGSYNESLALYNNVNLVAVNQSPALYQSDYNPTVIISGTVTDAAVTLYNYVSCSGIFFQDGGVAPTMNLLNVQLVLNNCFVTNTPGTGGNVFQIDSNAYVQLQDSFCYSKFFNVPATAYTVQMQGNTFFYCMNSVMYGTVYLTGSTGGPVFYAEYSSVNSANWYGIVIDNPGGYVESAYNAYFSGLACWNINNAAATVYSSFDTVYSTDPLYVALGTGLFQVGVLQFATNYGSVTAFSPSLTISYLPQSRLSLADTTATTATAGAATLPPDPEAFLPIVVNGTTYKLALYNV